MHRNDFLTNSAFLRMVSVVCIYEMSPELSDSFFVVGVFVDICHYDFSVGADNLFPRLMSGGGVWNPREKIHKMKSVLFELRSTGSG